jgi:hypothetical protein
MRPTLNLGATAPLALSLDWLRAVGFARVDEGRRTRSLLALRFALFNLIAVALTGAAWMQNWIAPLFTGVAGWMVGTIVAVFAVGWLWCARLIVDTAGELDQVKSGRLRAGSRTSRHLTALTGAGGARRRALETALGLKLQARIAGPRHLAGSLVFLGLIGTVAGFMIALSGVDPSRAGDATSVAPMVATLIDGMGLALSTTLVGAVLNLWLVTCWRMLEHGTAKLLAELLERGGFDDDA